MDDQEESTVRKAAWGSVQPAASQALSDVMSQQLADCMQEEEQQRVENQLRQDEQMAQQLQQEQLHVGEQSAAESAATTAPAKEETEAEGDNDYVLALMLQQEFDKEHDRELRLSEAKFNGNQKVRLTLANHYRRGTTGEPASDSEEEDLSDLPEPKLQGGPARRFNPRGYSGKGSNIRTKHDAEISGKRNADKMSEFGLTFRTGDTDGMAVKLNNKVFNTLKVHAMHEERRQARLHEKKDHSTAEAAVDERTRRMLFKMVNNGWLASLGGVVATGKESVVLHAACGETELPNGRRLPAEAAIKVFKTTLNEFKTRSIYVNGDYRFARDEFKKQNPRKVIRVWCEKELMNLKRMLKCGLPCPRPLLMKRHLLVMSFVGEEGVAAPRLKDCQLSAADWMDAWEQTVGHVRRLHDDCQLVHADLSEYNLLWWQDTVWIIDVSQSVERNHPHALEFLRRDCENVSTFFKRKRVPSVLDWEDLFNLVTGANIPGKGELFLKNFADYLASLQDYEKDVVHLDHGLERRQYQFDHFFDSSVACGDESDDSDEDAEEQDDEDGEEEEEEEEAEEEEAETEVKEQKTEVDEASPSAASAATPAPAQ